MDPPPPPPSNAAPTITKLRLMCSYSGHITRRPRTKSLSYLGGETRIISVDPTTVNTLSTFISHLLTILPIKPPFSLKYHLPHSALDSLISLSSSDDLHFMFSEHLRLSSSSSSSSRIRLFLFFPEPEKPHNVIHHPKTEAWFSDALKSAKILQKGRDCLVGFDGEGLIGENEVKGIVDLGNGGFSLPESMVLETSSSFGSSSSSASLANVSPPIKPQSEDFGLSSVASDSVATLASDIPPTNSCSSVENGVTSVPVITESNFHNLAAGVRSRNPHDFSGYARPNLFQHQELQFVQPSIPVESCLPVVYQMPSYYPVQQPQFVHYQPMPNHMYPVYYLPVGQTQVSAPSNLPVQAPVGQTQVSAPSNLPVQAPVGQTQISAPSNLPVQAPVGQTQISAPSNLPVQAPVGQTQISALSNLPVQAPVGQTQISAPSNLPVKAPVGQTQISAPSNLPVQAPVGQTQISALSLQSVQAPVGQTQISAPPIYPCKPRWTDTNFSPLQSTRASPRWTDTNFSPFQSTCASTRWTDTSFNPFQSTHAMGLAQYCDGNLNS
ncbi:hypothetical protein Csa_022250 [Cucumis sativus]|nr:hypothetical protein Csa_022250 [Cucumis sativus]